MANSFTIHPQDVARAVIVLETDDQHSGFEFILTASATEAAYFLSKNPTVLAWLPANAQGELRVFTKNAKVDGQPRHIFDLEIHGLADVRNDEGTLKDSDGKVIDIPVAESESGRWYSIECPKKSGHITLQYCPTGEHAVCEDGSPTCVLN